MTILYIDDDPDDLELFSEALRACDDSCTCITALNGKIGLGVLTYIRVPDYIFLDINMPVMDGAETLRRIRQDPMLQSVPVIMLSTTIHPADALIFEASGAMVCLVKPITLKELQRIIKRIISPDQ